MKWFITCLLILWFSNCVYGIEGKGKLVEVKQEPAEEISVEDKFYNYCVANKAYRLVQQTAFCLENISSPPEDALLHEFGAECFKAKREGLERALEDCVDTAEMEAAKEAVGS